MSGFQVSMKMEVKELVDAVKATQKRAKKALRTGVTKAGRILRRSIRQLLPKQSGLMRKRLSVVVKTYQPSGTVVAVVGIEKGESAVVPVKDVFRILGRGKGLVRGQKGGRIVYMPFAAAQYRMVKRNPQYVLHLIELGFTQANGRHVPAQAPIRRGYAAAETAMEQVIAAEFQAGVEGNG